MSFIDLEAAPQAPDGFVACGFLQRHGLPLVVQPLDPRLNFHAWCQAQREWIERSLVVHGAILFRGFDIGGQQDLEDFIHAMGVAPMVYTEGATPRTALGGHANTSTEYPAEHAIALHNELWYVRTWPMKLAFLCAVAALDRGATPIADVRRVYRRLTPRTIERFSNRGWMLVRNFGEGLGLAWQNAYRLTTRADLEAYAAGAGLMLEWRGERRLRTRQIRPTVAAHPISGELSWFNHVAFWHVSSLEAELRQVLLGEFGEEGLPYNTYYGDGQRIEESVVAELRAAYEAETVMFSWQRGDLLLLDNMLVAHGRQPFSGPRTILVSMGQPHTDRDL